MTALLLRLILSAIGAPNDTRGMGSPPLLIPRLSLMNKIQSSVFWQRRLETISALGDTSIEQKFLSVEKNDG